MVSRPNEPELTAGFEVEERLLSDTAETIVAVESTQHLEQNPIREEETCTSSLLLLLNEALVAAVTSGNFATVPLTAKGVKIILEAVKNGSGDGWSIRLPRLHECPPFMVIPHKICVNIMRQHIS